MAEQKKYQLKGMHMKVDENHNVTGLDPVGNAVVGTYFKIQNGVVGAYKSVEEGVVGTYKSIEDKFVDTFLEPVEDAPNAE